MLNGLLKDYAMMEDDHHVMVDIISQFQTKNSRIPMILTVKKEYHVITKPIASKVSSDLSFKD